MFKCSGCPKGNTRHGETLFKVTTVQRKVLYINQVRYDKQIMKDGQPAILSTYKVVGQKMGLETVEEKSYCQAHLPSEIKTTVLEKAVERINVVGIKRAFRGEN
jgi:hypothetical protein